MVRKLGRTSIGTLRLNRSRRYFSNSYSTKRYVGGSLLDRSISLRVILKYSIIILLFLIILGSVFMFGRISAGAKMPAAAAVNTQLSGQTKQVEKVVDDVTYEEPVQVPVASPKEVEPEVNDSKVKEDANITNSDDALVPSRERLSIEKPEVPCANKVAEFDYKYTKINSTVSDFVKEVKGENWATITSLKLTVTNNENCIIVNPTQIKIKLNPKGKGSIWWDDEVFLPDSFKHMLPGTSVSETVPVHVSYSDIYSEKDLKVSLFDDYDIVMATFKKLVTIK